MSKVKWSSCVVKWTSERLHDLAPFLLLASPDRLVRCQGDDIQGVAKVEHKYRIDGAGSPRVYFISIARGFHAIQGYKGVVNPQLPKKYREESIFEGLLKRQGPTEHESWDFFTRILGTSISAIRNSVKNTTEGVFSSFDVERLDSYEEPPQNILHIEYRFRDGNVEQRSMSDDGATRVGWHEVSPGDLTIQRYLEGSVAKWLRGV